MLVIKFSKHRVRRPRHAVRPVKYRDVRKLLIHPEGDIRQMNAPFWFFVLLSFTAKVLKKLL